MVDQVAKTSLVYDATGAKTGADEFKAAGDKIIASNRTVAQSEQQTADAIGAAEQRKQAAVRVSARAVADAAELQAAAAKAGGDALEKGAARQATTLSSQNKMLATYAKSFDPLGAAADKTAKQLANLQDVAARGGPNAARAMELIPAAMAKNAAAQKALSGENDNLAKTSNAASFAMRDLGLQSIDLFQGIATGQPIMRTLIQQGAQVVQVNAAMGVGMRQTAGMVASLFGRLAINPLTWIVGAVAGLAALGAAAETSARRMGDLTNRLGATRDNAAQMAQTVDAAAKHLAATTSLGTAESRQAGLTIGSAKEFQGTQAQLEALIVTADQLGIRLGTDLPTEAKEMAKALSDPAAVAKDLQGKLKGFDSELLSVVTHLQASGDKAGAFQKVLDAMRAAAGNVTREVTPLQQALAKLNEAITGSTAGGQSLAESFGGVITGVLAAAINKVTELIGVVERLKAALPAAPPGMGLGDFLKGGLGWLVPNVGAITPLLPGSGSPGSDRNPEPGWARNNPLNLTGSTVPGERFRTFPTQEAGIAAAVQQMQINQAQHGAATLAQQIARWAPPTENDTQSYIKRVAAETGIDPQAAFNTHDAAVMAKVVAAMSHVEFSGHRLDQATIDKGVAMGMAGTGTAGGAPATTPGGAANVGSVDDAVARAKALGVTSETAKAAGDDVKLLTGALADLAKTGETSGARVDLLNEALAKARLNLQNAISPADALTQSLNRQIDGQERIAQAYGKGEAEVIKVTAAVEAEKSARELAAAGLGEYAQLVQTLTAANERKAEVDSRIQLSQQKLANDNQLEMVKAETAALGMDNATRVVYLAHLQAEQQLKAAGRPLNDAFAKSYLASADALAKANQEMEQQKAALDTISGMFEQSFDTIGNAITQALVSGQGAAVNFRNVLTSVAQQILQQFMKLAILNPLLNNLFGGNRQTFGNVWDAVNKITPGSTTTEGGSSSGSGFLGGIIGAIGKIGGLFGGGGGDFATSVPTATTEALSALDATSSTGLGGGFLGGMKYHAGGIVGIDGTPAAIPLGMIDSLPRYHSGLGGSEFAAILQRGERVLTAQQQAQVTAAAANSNDLPPINLTVNFAQPGDRDTMRRAGQQVAGATWSAINRAKARNG